MKNTFRVRHILVLTLVFAALTAAAASVVELPEGYVRLEYILSSGSQYLDTGRKLHSPYEEVRMTFRCTKVNDKGMLFGNREDSTHFAFTAHYNNTEGSDMCAINVNNSSASGNLFLLGDYSSRVSSIYMRKLVIEASVRGATVTVGDEVCGPKMFSNVDTFVTKGTCTVLKGVPVKADGSGLPSNYGVTGELYDFSIISNGVTVLELIPVLRVTDEGEEVGMFDTVAEEFLGNVGEGEFVAGPEAKKPAEEMVVECHDGRKVDLAFSASEVDRKLLVCWGLEDGGENPSDWEHSEEVAVVPAGATSIQATLPRGFGKEYSIARFLLLHVYNTSEESLIARYDGIDNICTNGVIDHQNGTGVTWANLAGGQGMALGDCEAVADGVLYDRTGKSGVAFKTEAYAANSIKTIEAVVRVDGVQSGVDGAIWSGASAKPPVPQARVSANGNWVICGWNTEGTGKITSPWRTVSKGEAFSVAYVLDGSTWVAYVNGNRTTSTFSFSSTAGAIEFGNLSTADRGTKGKIYAIRLYSTALSNAQVINNYRADCQRFTELGAGDFFVDAVTPAIGAAADGLWITSMTRDKSTKVLLSAVLGFPKLTGAADVYAALAKGDCGDTTNGWSVVAKVATAAAESKSVTCDLTGLPCGEYSKIRFFMASVDEQVRARRYVSDDSFIRWWDGVWNSKDSEGGFCHDNKLQSWKDLLLDDAIDWNACNPDVVQNGIGFNLAGKPQSNYASANTSFSAGDIKTMEVAFTINGVTSGFDGVLWGGFSSANASPVPQCRVGVKGVSAADFQLGWESADSIIRNPFYQGKWGDCLTVTYVFTGSSYEAYTNGVSTGVSHAFSPATGKIAFANFPFAARGADVVYHSIRIYDRVLTPEEIAANYAADKGWLIDPPPLVSSRALSVRYAFPLVIIR